MALLIMRLKLFWTPHLCIFCSFIANKNELISPTLYISKCFKIEKKSAYLRTALIILIISMMSFNGIANVIKQHEIQGEYNDYTLENVVNWINSNTDINDPLAGKIKL